MVSAECKCGRDNSEGKRNCAWCGRSLEVSIMPDLTHIQNWPEIKAQAIELLNLMREHDTEREYAAVMHLLSVVLDDADTTLSTAERGVVPCTEA